MLYLFLADGFEETEALVPLDLIRRAGIPVLTVGVTGESVTGAHHICVRSDIQMEDVDLSDCTGVILPGGMPGTENLYADSRVRDAVTFCAENNKLIACICAAPIIPGRMGLLRGKQAVCFPGFEAELTGRVATDASVVADGRLITAKGAGCVFPFAAKIIEALDRRETADSVIRSIQYTDLT